MRVMRCGKKRGRRSKEDTWGWNEEVLEAVSRKKYAHKAMCFCEKERGNVWKDYMERIMNEENDWDHNVEGDAAEGPVVCVGR